MKKILLFVLVSFIGTSFAQTSIKIYDLVSGTPVAPNAVLHYTSFVGEKLTVTLDVENTGNTENTYSVKRYDLKLNKVAADNTEAVAFFCFAGTCYGAATMESDALLTLKPGKKASDVGIQYYTLDADLIEASELGFSWVKYTFFNVANVNDSAQVTFRYNTELSGGVGIKETNKRTSRIDIFPNPAVDHANLIINSSNNHTSKITILSSIGELVYDKEHTITEGRNSVHLNVQNLAAGVYFIQMKEGQAVTTKKLVIE